MIILPNSEFKHYAYMNKVYSYNLLHYLNLPVFKSVLFMRAEAITKEIINEVSSYLQNNTCTVRYQYIKPCNNPCKGGNKVPLLVDVIKDLYVVNTWLWLLEPIDRLENLYGINIKIDKRKNEACIECVGRGFDVSDINRGNIVPQQNISFILPVEWGWYNEFWKYLKIEFVAHDIFQESKIYRLKKLKKMGFKSINEGIFDELYRPLSLEKIQKLLEYISILYEKINEDVYVVSCSIDKKGKFVFWDIQIANEKQYIYQEGNKSEKER